MNTMRLFLLTFCLLTLNLLWAQTPEEHLEKLGIELPAFSEPSANYVKWRKVEKKLYFQRQKNLLKK